MNNDELSISKLEILSSQIFYDIFDYLSIEELYKSFYNLNNYLTLILVSYSNIPAKITSYKTNDLSIINFFSSRITRLSINYRYSINLYSFKSLHSIKILNKLNYFHQYSFKFLSNLEHICIVNNIQWNNKCLIQLSNDIMINSFPYLKLCQIGQIIYDQQYNWKYLLNLHSLTICIRDLNIYPKILHFCPYLIRFKLILDCFKKPILNEYYSHLYLRKLEVCLILRSISLCEIMDYLLYSIPNLTNLIINGPNHYVKQFNIDLLSSILYKHVSKLSQFYFQMAIDNTLALRLIQENFISIYRLHPLFIHTKVNRRNLHIPAKLIISS